MLPKGLKWIVPTLLLICVAICAHEAQAYFISGNELVEWMRGYEKTVRGECYCSSSDAECLEGSASFVAYVCGVFDATSGRYSLPDGVARGQVAAVVSKFLNEHPEEWSAPAALLVIEALKKAFPKK